MYFNLHLDDVLKVLLVVEFQFIFFYKKEIDNNYLKNH